MHKTAKDNKEIFKAIYTQMKYIDLHCDSLTESLKLGESLFSGGLQATYEKLKKSGCAAQCFAIFTQGEGAARFFEQSLNYYGNILQTSENKLMPITCAKQLESCLNGNALGSILTVENLGFIGEGLSKLEDVAAANVKMASLVWNYENELAYPNLIFDGGVPLFEKREERGLKELGWKTVEILDEHKIIIDISHLSDGGAEDILTGRKTPIVASHSNAQAVCNVSRNLSDGLIKKIADCGGVVGVNYCKDFLGEGATFERLFEHIRHLIKVGGEDIIALGSDFDGIPAPPNLEDCTRVPALFEYLRGRGLSQSVLEKLAYKNFLRVFAEVCG